MVVAALVTVSVGPVPPGTVTAVVGERLHVAGLVAPAGAVVTAHERVTDPLKLPTCTSVMAAVFPVVAPAISERVLGLALTPKPDGAGPVETTRLTAEPAATLLPAIGLWLMTLPEGTVLLDAVVTVPTVRPAPVIADEAAAWVSPTTLGTLASAVTVTEAVPDALL